MKGIKVFVDNLANRINQPKYLEIELRKVFEAGVKYGKEKPRPHIRTEIVDKKVNFYWVNNAYLGYAYVEVDGYYVFVFKDVYGCWAGYALREIADKLVELNKDWEEQIEKDFNPQ